MRLPARFSLLFVLGLLSAGSTALGVYYYYVYSPPLETAEAFMQAMEAGDSERLGPLVRISPARDSADLREPTPEEIDRLVAGGFQRGRILDQRRREGPLQAFHYLVYREPDGQIYALVVAERDAAYHVVVPEEAASDRRSYLWDYAWTN